MNGCHFFRSRMRLALVMLVGVLALGACDRSNRPLPGEREPLRPGAQDATGLLTARPISLPAPSRNATWSARNLIASGNGTNLALEQTPQPFWSVSIGAGDTKRARLLVTPVVSGGLIFTIDAAARLSATNTAGQIVWTRSIAREGERTAGIPGGGLAVSGDSLFVATGFGEVLALDAASGQTRWRHQFDAPVNGAPAIGGGRVFSVLRNDTAVALDIRDGSELWTFESTGGVGLLGGAVPLVDGATVILPFSSGEIVALDAASGSERWATFVSTGRRGLARARIRDISGDPVRFGSAIYTSSQSGRTIRLERATGERLWTMTEGSYGPVWPVGGSLFLMSDVATLVRADAARGEVIWKIELPYLHPNTSWLGDRVPFRAVTHFGPVLAGGQLWVASGDAHLRAFSPVDGTLRQDITLSDGASTAPVVAGGVMYVVTRDGILHAFR